VVEGDDLRVLKALRGEIIESSVSGNDCLKIDMATSRMLSK
jgi:hypothetical protein